MTYLKIFLLVHADHFKSALCIFLLGLLFKHKSKNGFEAFIIQYIVPSNAFPLGALGWFFFSSKIIPVKILRWAYLWEKVVVSLKSERSHTKGKWNFGITLQFICYCEEKALLIFLPLPLAFSGLDLLAKAASESWERPSAVLQLNRQDVWITFKVILLCMYFLGFFPGCWCFESSKRPLGWSQRFKCDFSRRILGQDVNL